MANADSMNPAQPGKLKHPRGLYTLFFTELWERLSYYGMRAILVLAMVAAIKDNGLGLDDPTATAIYGLYTAGVYLLALPGGWLADRLFGLQQAVWYGGIIIALGHFTMAIPTEFTFYLGMLLIVLGTGLLKPNVSAMVGELYPEGGARRDAGFSIYYMGINLGAIVGPLVCGYLGEKIDWHWGFGAAGVGMLIGLIQYRATRHYLGDSGIAPATTGDAERDEKRKSQAKMVLGIGVLTIALLLGGTASGMISIDPLAVAASTSYVIVGLAVLFFGAIYAFGDLDRTEKLHVGGIILFFIAAAVFWSGFEQAGSSLNLFAERYTDRTYFGWEMPASWLQMVNPLFIVILAPVFGSLWVRLAARNLNPSLPTKLALGLIQLGLGFGIMFFASELVLSKGEVWPTWLIFTYLLHTTGELCLSPVGLSAVTKLAPKRFVGQMMGTWFMGAALGNLIAGLVAGRFGEENLEQMPERFLTVTIFTCGFGLLMFVVLPWLKKLMGKVT